MKKLLTALLCISATIGAYEHQIFLSNNFRKHSGIYEFTLESFGFKSKTWRVEIVNKTPKILREGTININSSTEIRLSPNNSDIYIKGKAWCMDNLEIRVVKSSLEPKRIFSEQIGAAKRCKSHRFDVDVKDNKITITTRY